MNQRTLVLNSDQQQELENLRDTSPIPYLRERAGAMIKIADGMSPHSVSKQGLLKPREPDTVYRWLNRYLKQGITGLIILPRRKAFSP